MAKKPKQAKPIKMHGGKHYLANTIRQLAAPHLVRVFATVGGWAEGWNWVDLDVAEIINDVDGWLINFYEVLAEEKQSRQLIRKLVATPFSEPQWKKSAQIVKTWQPCDRQRNSVNQVLAAYHFFIAMRLSMSGRGDSFAPFTFCRLRNRMLEQASALFGAVDGLPEAAVRLRYVGIRNLPIAKLLPTVDKPGVWIYADPPYEPSTRVSKNVYRHEMTTEQHEEMLDVLGKLKHAKFLLSGYDCTLYRRKKKQYGFKQVTIGRPNASSTKKEKDEKMESFWANYDLPRLQSS